MSKNAPTARQLMSKLPNDVIKKSTKYDGVTAKIDSGSTIDKFYAKHSQATLNSHGAHTVTNGFKRIRLATLAKWMETAMIVLSEPNYIDSGESIYDLAGVPQPSVDYAESVTSTLSMAGTEATVCCEEPGVPPMYMFGPDVAEPEEANQLNKRAQQVEDSATFAGANSDLRQRNNTYQNYEAGLEQTKAIGDKNKTSSISFQQPQAPTTLNVVQQLTTRERHQKLLSRLHLKPEIKLEVFKGGNPGGKSLPIPCRTKQFCIVDMRSDAGDFTARHLWGSVHLPLSLLHRAGARMPGPLHYFAKFEESIFVVVGVTGPELEKCLNQLVDYGIAKKNIVPLNQTLDEAEQEHPNLFIRM
ncbi:Rhodanese-like_domain-containing protein [Hexamita inflata]|uniref:Rhodanese-like domain-containing protein n=1 Tax=Hexamita inflata TaxID=28002 RepID=A0AA86NMF2_9EUKA|nr:Rhodanese-like domain-containing protein [Hexamita inflata]CAI9950197.1 Rhodanese-like domain-containing protein [Hexamita inflata]CAI9951509.1 Rhodanese-like domain-containing protein [Hexamita inflata]